MPQKLTYFFGAPPGRRQRFDRPSSALGETTGMSSQPSQATFGGGRGSGAVRNILYQDSKPKSSSKLLNTLGTTASLLRRAGHRPPLAIIGVLSSRQLVETEPLGHGHVTSVEPGQIQGRVICAFESYEM